MDFKKKTHKEVKLNHNKAGEVAPWSEQLPFFQDLSVPAPPWSLQLPVTSAPDLMMSFGLCRNFYALLYACTCTHIHTHTVKTNRL